MPLVRIDVRQGRSEEERAQIGAAVQQALVETLDVPERDQFQVLTEHAPGGLVFNPGYLDVQRTDAFLLVHVFLAAGRSTEAKQRFYARLAALLQERTGLRSEDLAVVLTENDRADWSFGHGQASYLVLPKDEWR
jgi:4-oxalocrotonate tautomerase